jgi:cytoskeletal protein CcmA (bactofilin family)
MLFRTARTRSGAERTAIEPEKASADAQSARGEGEVLGAGVRVEGTVTTMGAVRVHGLVAGEIRAPIVVVMAEGVVEGDIFCREAEIHGVLRGRVTAPRVAIGATAIVEGRVIHNSMATAEGAHLDGRMPWRPLNYFDDVISDIEGEGRYEHVQP